ncbi:MAG: hypothetical protein AB7T06_44510 [Kofleriaceae bacterium]
MTSLDKLAETLLAPVGATLRFPDTRIVEREGWYQIITPSSGSAIANEVLVTRVADAEADAVLDRTCAEYAAEGVPFKWFVGPQTRPADLGARLEARGFCGVPVRGMAIEPRAWTAPSPREVTVELVTPATLDEYNACFVEGWGIPMPAGWRTTHASAIDDGRFERFIARIDGVAAGTCGSVRKERCVYLVGGNVIAAHRRRGVYRAMLAARLARATVPLAVTHAREETSAPILERLGFESMFSATIYRND